MAHIVLDGLPLAVRSAGIATYTRELTRAMAGSAPTWQFTLLQPQWPRRGEHPMLLGENVAVRRLWHYPCILGGPPAGIPRLRSLESAIAGVDLFHGTSYSLPRRCRAPLVATVHDLALLRHPEWGTRALVRMVRRAVRELHAATRIIAVSESTRRDLIDLCGVPPDRVRVVHNGHGGEFRPLDANQSRARIERELGVGGRFVLHVGTLEPRKNLTNLIAAFAQVRLAGADRHRLVLAGADGWGSASIHRAAVAHGIAASVRFVGCVAADLLPALYAAADVVVYPSLHEGFGLPVLEAMACGTPVVAANRAAIPEVAGDAALLVDPENPEEIAAAINRCLQDRGLAADLTRRGMERAAAFTWERAAAGTMAVYREILGE